MTNYYIPNGLTSNDVVLALASGFVVNLASTVKQVCFVVPNYVNGCIVTTVIARNPSSAIVLATTGFGYSAACNDVIPVAVFSGLSATNAATVPALLTSTVVGQPGAAFGCKPVITANQTFTIDVFGYMF